VPNIVIAMAPVEVAGFSRTCGAMRGMADNAVINAAVSWSLVAFAVGCTNYHTWFPAVTRVTYIKVSDRYSRLLRSVLIKHFAF